MKKLFLILIFFLFLINPVNAKTDKMNVLFTIDNNYAVYTLLSINSILLNNSSNSKYTFYIIETDLSDKNKRMMENFIFRRNQDVEFINISPELLGGSKVFNHVHAKHITPIAMARLFAPDLLPKEVDRVLYLDSDTLITTDLQKLYNTDLENNIAGLIENYGKTWVRDGLYPFKKYYNSGVILLDLDKCRKDNSSKKFMDFYYNNIDKFIYNEKTQKPVYGYVDQDLINLIWENKIKSLDKKWNQQQIIVSPDGIYYFIGPTKPWHMLALDNTNLDKYHKYWIMTPEMVIYRIISYASAFASLIIEIYGLFFEII